jgi:hypothetical protein
MPGHSKLRREIEPRWVAEYCAQFYPKFPVRYRCALGPAPPGLEKAFPEEKALRIGRPWRPEADAVVIKPDELIIIEAKVFRYMDGLSKLPVYRDLVDSTPELEKFKKLPRRMQLLLPAELKWVENAAKPLNVEVVVWAPDWVKAIWEERDKYWTKEATQAREERKKILRAIGYA